METEPDIKIFKSKRDSIPKTELQKKHIMPSPGLTIFFGRTQSGKTNLILNILGRKMYLKNYFDLIYVFCLSPCTMLEDNINIKQSFMDDDPEKAKEILETQKQFIKTNGFKSAPHILFILDDVVQSPSFINHPVFRELAFASTHSKCSVFLTAQSYCAVPKRIRTNCGSLFLFNGLTDNELIRFTEEHQPHQLKKIEFMNMVKFVIDDNYSFMFVNCSCPDKKKKFRKGFFKVLKLQ